MWVEGQSGWLHRARGYLPSPSYGVSLKAWRLNLAGSMASPAIAPHAVSHEELFYSGMTSIALMDG